MRVCHCTLAGTQACLICPNNGAFISVPYWFPIKSVRTSSTITKVADKEKEEKRYEAQIGYDNDFIKDNKTGKYYDSFDIADKLNYYDEENAKLSKALNKSIEEHTELEKEYKIYRDIFKNDYCRDDKYVK